ncbi:MAG: SIS domain-containing protein [bacterium]|nr:SIS domain-containing protein [bacterium]
MNTIERMFAASGSCEEYARRYFAYLGEVAARLDLGAIARFADLLDEARREGRTIFFIGNGGSAATSSHFANDLGKGALVAGRRPFRAQSLTDNISLITALANDEGYDRIFVAQLESLLDEGDVVVGISASGNSPNVVKAFEYANARGARTVAVTGFSGGRLREIAGLAVHIETPGGEYGPVEDFHMILDHLVTTYLKMRLEREE